MDIEKVVEEFTKALKEQIDKINELINAKPDNNYLSRLELGVNQINLQMKDYAKQFAESNIPTAFEEGENITNNNLDKTTTTKGEDVKEDFRNNLVSTDKNIYQINTFTELSNGITKASESVISSVNAIIKAKPNITMANLQSELLNALQVEAEATGTPYNVTYSDGKKVSIESYAKMVGRSSIIESQNVGSFTRAKALGNDLVKCTEFGATCPICAKYEGRVYSISGNNQNYPPLYGTALKPGYSLIHPNCRHEFIPYREEFDTEEDVKKLQEKSNQPFVDDRTESEREAYGKSQWYNTRAREEFKEFDEFRLQAFKDFPYKSIGAFRRAKRANTDTYKKFKQKLTTQQQA